MDSQAGIMEEMLNDTLDMEEDEELEDEADAEVDKVLAELTDGKLGLAGSAGTELPVSSPARLSTLHAYLFSFSRFKTSWKRKRRSGRWKSIVNN
jgi:hypothetical protein